MDDYPGEHLLSASGRIVKRQPNGNSPRGEDIVRSSKRLVTHNIPEDNNGEAIDPEEIERIIRERRQRFNEARQKTKKEKTKQIADEQSNRSKGQSEREQFQAKRVQKKGELLQRINNLEGRIQKDKADPKIRIHHTEESNNSEPHSPSPSPPPRLEQPRIPDRFTNQTFKQILEDMRLRHRQEIISLTRHNDMKVRSLETMLRSKDSIIRQLELEATRTQDYIQQLQKALNNAP